MFILFYNILLKIKNFIFWGYTSIKYKYFEKDAKN